MSRSVSPTRLAMDRRRFNARVGYNSDKMSQFVSFSGGGNYLFT
jgi:hypothetical protein